MENFKNSHNKKRSVQEDNTLIRSEMISEIISSKQGYFSRFALVGIFIVLALLLTVTWFVPYPESISLQTKISGNYPAKIFIGGQDSFAIKEYTHYAQFFIPQKYFSKVSVGAPVQLRVEAYPYNEYGAIRTKISYISSVASDSGFLACVLLPRNAVATRSQTIEFRQGLRCEALIIITEGRLLEKLYKGVSGKINVLH